MKKLTLVMAAFGLVMLAACGDDSSSNSSSTDKDAQGRTIYHSMIDAMEAPCSEANQCEEIIMDDPIAQDTLICLGTLFQSKIGRDLSKCGVTSADDPATDISPVVPATDTPAEVTPTEAPATDTPAEVTPTDVPATDTPAASEAGPTGDLVSCDFVAEGVLGEHSCVEAVASDAVVPAFCQTMGSMGEGITATSGTSCNAPETALKCVKNGMNFYSLDGNSATCDEFFKASVLQGLAVSL